MNVANCIESNRLILRKVVFEDWSILLNTISHPLFPENLPLKERIITPKDAQSYIRQRIKAWETLDNFTWSICLREDMQVIIGQVGLAKRSQPDTWALSFWVSPAYQRFGYAKEAVTQIIEFIKQKNKSITFWAGAATWNKGSNKVLKCSGFKFIKLQEDGYTCNNTEVSINVYEKN